MCVYKSVFFFFMLLLLFEKIKYTLYYIINFIFEAKKKNLNINEMKRDVQLKKRKKQKERNNIENTFDEI